MSLKVQSLGVVAGGTAHEGLRVSSTTNATPIVATINTGHGLKVADRVISSGITGNTGANGTFGVSAVAATTLTFEGSSGNGTHGGTALLRVAMDKTPFMQRWSAVAFLGATDAYDGVGVIESSADNVSFADAVKGVALPAGQDNIHYEVELGAYMRFRSSTAGATGAASAQLMS